MAIRNDPCAPCLSRAIQVRRAVYLTRPTLRRLIIRSRSHDFIPLLEEVRLKRPDLFGLNSHNLYGSVQFEGSRSTPLPTPLIGRRQNTWDVNSRVRNSTAAYATATPSSGEGNDMQRRPSLSSGHDYVAACSGVGCDVRSGGQSSQNVASALSELLAPFSQNMQVSHML